MEVEADVEVEDVEIDVLEEVDEVVCTVVLL